MTSPTDATVETRTLSVPGAELTYDVHGDLATATAGAPALVLIGTPLGPTGS
ncbi:hypothetical protein [Microlunatus antarcticus]|uniref:Alpha/beta hydrolase n=1 Tax=Microlunatus antarcticus TaxID=53388 RepID=A0A7W5JX84_9ACTN|nr:hypothetical protein [Microlunatus antarcticus]MBB3327895.1 hypothetical protein [Microlunatus antarcticus]